jgi:hypothetical protein
MSAKRIVKFLFGLLTFLVGGTILVWCAYSLVFPGEHFRFRTSDLPRLLLPLVFIWFGWLWMRGESTPAAQYSSELILTLKLSGSDYGTDSERRRVLDLKHRLERALGERAIAEIDGEEFGGGECSLFVQTDAPTRAAEVIRQFLASESSFGYTLTTHSNERAKA